MNKTIKILIIATLLLATSVFAYHRVYVFVVKPDINRNGCVDMGDFGVLANCFVEYEKRCDLNSDGVINERDIDVFKGFYGVGCD